MKIKNSLNKIKQQKKIAEIGVIGGSGFYELFEKAREIKVNTPFGAPSEKILVGSYQGKKVAFLARHGKKHHLPPHKIPYRANIWALRQLGVERLITTGTVGSLQPHIKPGDFVITDHFVDRTKQREDTFFSGPEVAHFSVAEPYCPTLRKIAMTVCAKEHITYHKKGTIIVIEGPRFSTKPESRWFATQGFDVINMTHYPEVILARELDMCLVNIALVTDFDAGLEGNPKIKPVTFQEIIKVFNKNVVNVKKVVLGMIPQIPEAKQCKCWRASETAFV
ncbi:S-methyl-5'-thioadenosine phosphorylase [Candidatus Kuenenbacteria bacterium]|nr:S-methyl-5'-thioadenosine phosphorylase [Candidatus Kuenenbacteria bacterium]